MKKKLCIITAGAGFLGKKFCKFFSKNNYLVYCLDNNMKNLSKLNKYKYVKTFNIDITDEKSIKKFYDSFKNK